MALEDIEAKQRAITEVAKKTIKEKDPDELRRLADKIAGMAKELEKSCKNLAAAVTPPAPHNESGETRVVLTPDQRQRIVEQTGIGLETLVVDKGAVALANRMPTMQKRMIEQLALQQAAVHVAAKARKKAFEQLIKELEKIDDPTVEVQEIIAQLKKDPEGIAKVANAIAARQLGKNAEE